MIADSESMAESDAGDVKRISPESANNSSQWRSRCLGGFVG